ncbi:MAG: hypothetical protein ACRYFS_08405 [Janthinobacterium lividum]
MVLALTSLLVGRLGVLIRLGTRAATRLETSRIIPTLWGLAAGLLFFLLAAILFNSHTFALLGFLVLAAGLALAGLGLAVVALSVGTRLSEAFDLLETENLSGLRLGLWSLGLAAGVPFAGWLFALLLLASGIGAVLEALIANKVLTNNDKGS